MQYVILARFYIKEHHSYVNCGCKSWELGNNFHITMQTVSIHIYTYMHELKITNLFLGANIILSREMLMLHLRIRL